MIRKIAQGIAGHPKRILLIALILLIPAALGAVATRVNYDILTYIPQEIPSAKGELYLEEPFHMAATGMLIVEGMPDEYVVSLQKQIKTVDTVSAVLSLPGTLGASFSTDILPEDMRSVFYSKDKSATMMLILFDYPAATEETMNAISQIRSICNEKCFMAGFSAMIADTRALIETEMPFYIAVAALLAVLAMGLMMESWLLPIVILGNIGMAILFNMGTNALLGEISFVTNALAAILQLGVTMDYSVFLYSRYREERSKTDDTKLAMTNAVEATFSSLFGSSLTTVAGFASLCFMRMTLGRDVGIVMMKGVILGVLCVIFVLPSLLLLLENPIEKYRHKCFQPNFTPINTFLIKHRRLIIVVMVLCYLPAIYSQRHTGLYNDLIGQMLPADTASVVASNKLKNEFGQVNQHFIILHDTLSSAESEALADELRALPGIGSVISYDTLIPPSVPDFFVPSGIKNYLKQDGMEIMLATSDYETASEEMDAQVAAMQEIILRYDKDAYLTGSPAMMTDLIDVCSRDFDKTSLISMAAVFLIILFVFKSLSLPVLLVATIEFAIFVNEGIPYWTGTSIPFIANTFVGCIQLGATVDYSILVSSRFKEERKKGLSSKEAIIRAASASDHSIISSSLVLFGSCLAVSLISTMQLVNSLCTLLARGALISAVVCIFILPAVLSVTEPLIAKLSIDWPKIEKHKRLQDKPIKKKTNV